MDALGEDWSSRQAFGPFARRLQSIGGAELEVSELNAWSSTLNYSKGLCWHVSAVPRFIRSVPCRTDGLQCTS